MYYEISEMNRKIKSDAAAFIAEAERSYHDMVKAVAMDLHEHRDVRPILLLSGPSGAGKTTTAMTIESLLDSLGYETHTLCMDDYFLPLSEEEKNLVHEGKLDLESPERVDVPLLNAHLEKMINCEPVEVPKFDFVRSARKKGATLTRKPGEIIVLEGIHVLNPAVVTIPAEQTAKMYISVRSRQCLPDGSEVHPSRVRLLRRIMRDETGRGRSAKETLRRYREVERGAQTYIMPFKTRADYEIDTFIPYEPAVYKPLLLEELKTLGGEAEELVRLLDAWEEIPASLVPHDSLLREFIGDGKFTY